MSGFFTNGLPDWNQGAFPSTARFPMDSGQSEGLNPQSAAVSPGQILAGAIGAAVPLAYAATQTLDASDGGLFSVTLTGNMTLTVENAVPGQILYGYVTQDGAGSRVITVSDAVKSGTPLSTTGNAKDLVAIMCLASDSFLYWPVAKAFA